MPTFKLEEFDDSQTFGGDNDMYFRQWRAPSMKPVLERKLDRDFQAAVEKKDDFFRRRAEAKQKHGERFEKRLEALNEKMSRVELKENRPIVPAEKDLKKLREKLELEFQAPSSTAKMSQAAQLRPKPRQTPIFGGNMAGLKNLVLPPVATPVLGKLQNPETPKDNSFLNNSHETVFYPQTHSSFNLDHYNGNRPSFAFAGLNAATSTPVSKFAPKFSVGSSKIDEEDGFDDTKYVTAMESPVFSKQKAREAEEAELQARKAAEQELIQAQKVREAEEAEKQAREAQKAAEEKRKAQQAEEAARTAQKAREALKAAEEKQKAQRAEEEARKAAEAARAAQTAREAELLREFEDAERAELEAQQAQEAELQAQKTAAAALRKPQPSSHVRIGMLFKKYIALLAQLKEEKKSYESSSDPAKRSLMKRTITEKVTVFTQRETSQQTRDEILLFFRKLLLKEPVDGFSLGGQPPKLQLVDDLDVCYAVTCLVEKYISLAELDSELAVTISDLITRLGTHVKRVERVFIVMITNASALLRQDPDECREEFVDSPAKSDEKAMILNRENALVTLFFNVLSKSAYMCSKGLKKVLNEDILWKVAESTVANAPGVPQSAVVVLQMILTCKPVLCENNERWMALLDKIWSETLPALEEASFPGDEAAVSNLKQFLMRLDV